MSEDYLKNKIAQLEQELEQSQAHAKTLGNLLEKKLNEIYTHYHISRTIASQVELREMIQQVFGIIQKAIPFDRISVYLLDAGRENLDLVYFSGLEIRGKLTLPFGNGTPGRVVENGEHVHIHDLSVFYETFNDFIHFPDEEKRNGSYIGIALKVHQATIGVIGMDNPEKFGLTVDDMDFMAILSHQIAAGIEKAKLFATIERISQHDGLTGLYNHRMFEERLYQEIGRRDRTLKPLSLVMLDIDHFKQFNDNFGHQAGDSVLRQLSEIIMHQSRSDSIDICCRYGGEEFAIIMPEQELGNAVRMAERLRNTVENHAFTIREGHAKAGMTISLGVATVTGNEDVTPEQLVKQADEALYLSKKNGRNRVSSAQAADQ